MTQTFEAAEDYYGYGATPPPPAPTLADIYAEQIPNEVIDWEREAAEFNAYATQYENPAYYAPTFEAAEDYAGYGAPVPEPEYVPPEPAWAAPPAEEEYVPTWAEQETITSFEEPQALMPSTDQVAAAEALQAAPAPTFEQAEAAAATQPQALGQSQYDDLVAQGLIADDLTTWQQTRLQRDLGNDNLPLEVEELIGARIPITRQQLADLYGVGPDEGQEPSGRAGLASPLPDLDIAGQISAEYDGLRELMAEVGITPPTFEQAEDVLRLFRDPESGTVLASGENIPHFPEMLSAAIDVYNRANNYWNQYLTELQNPAYGGDPETAYRSIHDVPGTSGNPFLALLSITDSATEVGFLAFEATVLRSQEAQDKLGAVGQAFLDGGPVAADQLLREYHYERPFWQQLVSELATPALGGVLGGVVDISRIGGAAADVGRVATRAGATAIREAPQYFGEALARSGEDVFGIMPTRTIDEGMASAGDIAGGELGVLARATEAPPVQTPSLASRLADEADALRQTPPPTAAVNRPAYSLTSSLKTLDEISQDIQNNVSRVGSALGRVPVIRTAVNTINPSALTGAPPVSLVDDIARMKRLPREAAQQEAVKLQSDLLAHTRAVERGNNLVASVEEAINREARKVGLVADRNGLLPVQPKGNLAPTIGEVFENPSQFILTPRQRQFVDDIHLILEDTLRIEKAKGVDVTVLYSDEGRYFPRAVREVNGIQKIRADIAQAPGRRQGFQKGRFYETMTEGMDQGVRYSDNIGATVGLRLRAGLKAGYDEEFADLVGQMGRAPTKTAPTRFGEMGTNVPALGPRVYPEQEALRIIEQFRRQPPHPLFAIPELVNTLLRPIQASGDLGFTLLQNLMTLATRPVSAAKAFGVALDTIVNDGRLTAAYFRRNAQDIERAVADGLMWNGSEFTFEDARRTGIMSNLISTVTGADVSVKGVGIGFGRFQRGFNTALNVAGLENYKAIMGLRDAGIGPQLLTRLERGLFGDLKGRLDGRTAADIANKMTGRVSSRALGTSATQRSIESSLLFAPRYHRAFLGLLGDAVQGGMRGAEARRVFTHLLGGAVLTHVAISKITGEDLKLNPLESNWLQNIMPDGTVVYLGGPFRQYLRLGSEIAQALSEGRPEDIDNLLVNRLRSMASPVVGKIADQITGKKFQGSYEFADKFSGPLDRIKSAVIAAPFSLMALLEDGPTAAGTTFVGGSAFQPTPTEWDQINKAAEQRFGLDWNKLDLDQRAAMMADPAIKALFDKMNAENLGRGDPESLYYDRVREITEQINAEQLKDDADFAAGRLTFDEWNARKKARDAEEYRLKGEAFDQIKPDFGEPDDPNLLPPLRRAVKQWQAVSVADHTNSKGVIDWDGFYNARDAALAGLDPLQLQKVYDELEKNDTPTVRAYKQHQRDIDDAWDEVQRIFVAKYGETMDLDGNANHRRLLYQDPDINSAWAATKKPFTPTTSDDGTVTNTSTAPTSVGSSTTASAATGGARGSSSVRSTGSGRSSGGGGGGAGATASGRPPTMAQVTARLKDIGQTTQGEFPESDDIYGRLLREVQEYFRAPHGTGDTRENVVGWLRDAGFNAVLSETQMLRLATSLVEEDQEWNQGQGGRSPFENPQALADWTAKVIAGSAPSLKPPKPPELEKPPKPPTFTELSNRILDLGQNRTTPFARSADKVETLLFDVQSRLTTTRTDIPSRSETLKWLEAGYGDMFTKTQLQRLAGELIETLENYKGKPAGSPFKTAAEFTDWIVDVMGGTNRSVKPPKEATPEKKPKSASKPPPAEKKPETPALRTKTGFGEEGPQLSPNVRVSYNERTQQLVATDRATGQMYTYNFGKPWYYREQTLTEAQAAQLMRRYQGNFDLLNLPQTAAPSSLGVLAAA